MNNLSKEKTMTVKEIAEVFNVSRGLIEKRIRELFPGRMRQGKTTHLNESEVAIISIRLKENPALIDRTNSLDKINNMMGTSYGRKELEA
jgi:transposase